MDTELTGTDTQAPFIQLLSPDGTRRQDPAWERYTRDVDLETLRGFYRDMAATRRLDDEGTALQRQGQLVLWVPLKGQEAAQIGSGRATVPQDYLFPTYREHGVAITRGVQIAEMLRVFRGISHGGWDPTSTGFHNYTMVLAAQTLHAVGYAMGVQRDQKGWDQERLAAEGGAVMAYFGDGASSEGDVHESMVFAASTQAPVVFFCQNNQWAISVPFATQSRVPLATRAAGYGFEGLRVDGNDILAVVAATRYALDRIRRGEGPVLIEAETYRMGAHTTADDPTKYRKREEEDQWGLLDPVERLTVLLRTEHGVEDSFFATVATENDELARRMRADVLAMTPPEFVERFENVYAEPHSLVEAERAEYLDYQAGFDVPDDAQDAHTEGAGA